MTHSPDLGPPDEDEGRIGIFASWNWLYASVVIYTIIMLVVLYVFTVTLDHGIG
ncbi:MAG: hypothetical protein OEZ65_03150 [Gemmatimonadota bacterium]|nr:hypothetical protein [Gemmatimonadota bacterium]MDH5758560.1 hypothetical protein [Gemmatimonadota bacterium]